jgi:acetoin utilization deacetylase AcuC-like enzyme
LSQVALVYGDVFLKHETGGHVENKRRVSCTLEYLKSKPLFEKLQVIEPRPATADEILLVHSKAYYDFIRTVEVEGIEHLDPDTVFSSGSREAAFAAAGAVTLALEKIKAGTARSAFCLVRPPGHHARPARAMGFCIFNNIAIGAAYASHTLGYRRSAIIDFDVHHGNGTQEMFYADPTVLYCSVHRSPFYPGTGSRSENGKGPGGGKTVNVPLPPGSDEEAYLDAMNDEILPQVRDHRPEIIFISAGFDAHEADPLGGMKLSSKSYRKITQAIAEVASEICEGRMVSALEGGYNLEALATSVHEHLQAMVA